jgi:hypothetical protein
VGILVCPVAEKPFKINRQARLSMSLFMDAELKYAAN